MKRIWVIIFCVLMLQTKVFAEQSISIMLNGEGINTDTPPIMEQGRVLVPIRLIAESFKGNVTWDNTNSTVVIKKGDTDIKVTVGQKVGYRNNQPIQLDVPVKILKGRTYVPLRFVAESLGEVVNWRSDSKAVVMLTQEFIQKTTNDVTSIIDKVNASDGAIEAPQVFHEKWRDWHKLLDGFPEFTDCGINYVPYEYWIPENEPKLFIVRMINRWKTMDDEIYSTSWLKGSTPVQDTILFIDLSDNSFHIKWVGVLTGDSTKTSIPFDNSTLDKNIQEKLPEQLYYYPSKEKKDFVWGWEKQYGIKPVFDNNLIYFEHSLATDRIIQKN